MSTADLSPPAAVITLTRALEEAGFETWAVGGAVRDGVLGRAAGDWDLATAARPKQTRRVFRRTVPIGVEHGTIGVLGDDEVLYEVTTFRRDVETTGRHAVVEFADTIDEDLSRRDFTFNAIAWHPLRRELRDPFGGVADLETRTLRTVGEAAERFAEDYLRVLRALRFAGQLELRIDEATWSALVDALAELPRLSAERVREELWKILRETTRASRCLSLYACAGVLDVLYPELEPLIGLRGGEADTIDVWTRGILAVDSIPPQRTVLRLAALLHAVGMPGARVRDLRGGGWRYTGHPVHGAALAERLLRRLRASNADMAVVGGLIALQDDLFPPDSPSPVVRRWLAHVEPQRVNDLFRLRFALLRADPDAASGAERELIERWRMARAELRRRPPLGVADVAIGGHDLRELGLEPGPRFGEILDALLERVLEDPSLNEPETLRAIVREEYLDR